MKADVLPRTRAPAGGGGRSTGLLAVDQSLGPPRQRFWRDHNRLGFLVLTAEALFVFVYFAVWSSAPHRSGLLVVSSLTVLAALAAMVFVDLISRHSWRTTFSVGSVLLAGSILTFCICLDGGLHSPLLSLLALPVMSAAIGLPPREVAICGLAAFVEFGMVVFTDTTAEATTGTIAASVAFLAGTVALSVGAAVYRSRLEGDEHQLIGELQHRARTDSLTGCLSHGAFYEVLGVEIDRALRHAEPLALLVIDVDLFKSFNDTHGHAAGDRALARVGATMRHLTRSVDHVARIGGDEFAVILPHTDLTSAGVLAERIIHAVADGPGSIAVSVSVGVATLDTLEPSGSKIFHEADKGLYLAKANGRGRSATIHDVGDAGPYPPRPRPDDPVFAQADWDRLEEGLRESNRATAEASSIIDSLEAAESIGFGYVDRDFRLIRINSMLAAAHGGRIDEQIGRRVADVVPALWPTLEPLFQQVIERGEAMVNQEVAGLTAADPGRTHYWLSNLSPVKVGDSVIGIAIVVLDITDRKQLEQGQATLTKAVVAALSASVELRDPYTAGHQDRVARIAVAIASELHLDRAEIDLIGLAARIHDIGKLSVPSEILARPSRLTAAEMAVVRMHCQVGFDLLHRFEFPSHVADMVFQHHERMDGSGYPNGLHGAEIALGSRIIAVADVVESMVSLRPYRAPLGLPRAIREIQNGAGTIYDPDVVDACLKVIGSGLVPLDHDPDAARSADPAATHEAVGGD